jgi:hypothetical protein
MMILSFTGMIVSVLVVQSLALREPMLGTQDDVLWYIGKTPQVYWTIGIFIVGTFFGSAVLRQHFTNGIRGSSQDQIQLSKQA